MGLLRLACVLLLAVASPRAATLERLSFEAMAQQATSIVRGKVQSIRTERSKGLVYTVYSLAVSTSWKGYKAEQVEVSSIGGTHDGVTQKFGGAPVLDPGAEYVAFVWRGKSGRSQILGLSQGLFKVVQTPEQKPYLLRDAIEGVTLVSEQGEEIEALRLSFVELETKIRRALAKETPSQ